MSKSKYHDITFPATKDKRRVLNYEVIGDNTKGNERTCFVLRAPDTETKPKSETRQGRTDRIGSACRNTRSSQAENINVTVRRRPHLT